MILIDKSDPKKYSIAWIIYFVICIGVVIFSSIYQKSGPAMLISSICGIIYVLLIAKNNKAAYIFGIVNVIIYGIILITQKIYGSAAYNLLYSLPMFIFGYYKWKKIETNSKFGIKKLDRKIAILGSIIGIIIIAMYTFMVSYMGGNFALLDGVNVITGILAVYLLAHKYMEQTYMYILMNLSGLLMWSILTYQNIQNLPILLMWLIYTINSFYTLVVWKKMFKQELVDDKNNK